MADLGAALRRMLDEYARTHPVASHAVLVSRGADGEATYRDVATGCEFVAAAGSSALEGVTSCVPIGDCGQAVNTGDADVIEDPSLSVDHIEPSSFEAGQTVAVKVIGKGFSNGAQFDFLQPDSDEINPDITIVSQNFVNDGEIDLSISIASGAAIIENAPLAYGPLGQVYN